MYERYPISGIKQTYRHTTEIRTVIMPLLIMFLLGGMITFYFKTRPIQDAAVATGERAPAQSVFSESENSLRAVPVEGIDAKPDGAPEPARAGGKSASTKFTPWMSPIALDTYIRFQNEGHEVSFWKRGHWITAIEGRWSEARDEHQFRITYEKIPEPDSWKWQYRIDQRPEEFFRNAVEMQNQGFVLVDSQSFDHPDGEKRHQSIWQKKDAIAGVVDNSVEAGPPVRGGVLDDPPVQGGDVLDVNRLEFR
jgi:hypothetical protein